MNANEHHASCTPNDKSLVWHCSQCGLDESAGDVEERIETLEGENKRLNDLLASIGEDLKRLRTTLDLL